MAPPTIQTSITQFSVPRAASHPDEVVIDGESSATDSDDDNDVMVITPRARKRRRTSAIMDDDDDDGDANKDNSGSSHATRTTTTPVHTVDQQGGSDDDDEVEIVQIGATATPLDGSASKKSRRLTVADSDNDDADDASAGPHARALATRASSNTPNPRRHSTGGITPSSNASSSRRSSRIERKRLDKVSEPSSVRKLEYLNLDNCLDELGTPSKTRRAAAQGSDDDDTDDFEDDDDASRTRRPQREVEREGRHADGDDDLDTFIVGDNDVEYMDDDEDGVISVASESNRDGDDEGRGDDEDDEIAAHRAMQQTREPSEWFHLYMEYLEESILDADLDAKMRRRPFKADYVLYREATRHIERAMCSRRDNLRGNVVWPDEMLHALHHACYFRSSRCSAEQECEACNRQNHMATYSAQLGGVMCDATALYREGWMPRLRKSMLQGKTVNVTFEMGSVCHARTLAYWQLLHAKRFWCALIDDKRRSSGDVTGRIRDDVREAFFRSEFGRYKRLLNLVDTFESEGRQANVHMANVWKRVTVQHCTSDFLPVRKHATAAATRETRRGAMDAFVGESEDDDGDESGDDEDALERKAKGDAERASGDSDDEDLEEKAPASGAAESRIDTAPPGAATVSAAPASDVEDLLCLVCGENPRNGGIVHGQYLHFYSCYRCGKRQQRAHMGCLVCDRPIDKVLRLLPLTPETRKAIQQQQQALK